MSDVEKNEETTEATTEESDFEGHRKRGRDANDESGTEQTGEATDDSDSDFEAHRKRGRD